MNIYQENPIISEGIIIGKNSIPRNVFAWGLKRARDPKKIDVMPEIISVGGHLIAPGGIPLATITGGSSLLAPSIALRTLPRNKRLKTYRKIVDGTLNSDQVITKWAIKHGIDPAKLISYIPIK